MSKLNSFSDVLSSLKEIQKLYHDSAKQIPTTLPADVTARSQEKLEKTKKQLAEKVNELKENIHESQREHGVELVEEILEKIRQSEKIAVIEVPYRELPLELSDLKVKLKTYAGKFKDKGKKIDVEAEYNKAVNTYHELLAYTKLAFQFEKNGSPEEHALKLAVLFGDTQSALSYLKKNTSVHDACLFTLPPVDKCDFNVWQSQAKKNMLEPEFRELLPFASEIEGLIAANVQEKKPDYKAIAAKKDQITTNNTRWKELKRKHGELDDTQEKEYQNLSIERMNLNTELLELSAGVPLALVDMLLLQAYNEKAKMNASPAYKYFREYGLTKEDHKKFLALDRREASQNIPDMFIDGKDLGYPGFYLKKVNVQDEKEAARVACGGKLTNCCQSLSGEAGETCVIHGLTSKDGGFYVVCSGDAINPKVEDELLGLTWAWRSKNGAIVFDSIETSRGASDQKMATDFYRGLAKELVVTGHTHKVACGASSGISSQVGIQSLVNQTEEFLDYHGYSDSTMQLIIFDINKPYYWFGLDEDCSQATETMIKNALSNPQPLGKSADFMTALNWALVHEHHDLLDKIKEITAIAHPNLAMELECLIKNIVLYLSDSLTLNEILSLIEKNELHIDIVNRDGITPLLGATSIGNQKLAFSLIDKGANLNQKDSNCNTALLLAVKNGYQELAFSLIDKGANVNEKELKTPLGYHRTILIYAIKNGLEKLALSLIDKGANVNEEDRLCCTPLMYAVQYNLQEVTLALIDKGAKGVTSALNSAILYGHHELALAIIDKGVDVNEKDNDGKTALLMAVGTGNQALTLALLRKGANTNQMDSKLAILLATENRFQELVVALYSKMGNGKSDILYATQNGLQELALVLTDKGENVNEKDDFGNTALLYAAQKKLEKLALALIEKGANVNDKDTLSKTPLLYAAENGLQALALELIEKGADVDAKGNDDKSALELAIDSGHPELAQQMEKKIQDLKSKPSKLQSSDLFSKGSENGLQKMHETSSRPRPVILSASVSTTRSEKNSSAKRARASHDKGKKKPL